jgi:hypothetical protein
VYGSGKTKLLSPAKLAAAGAVEGIKLRKATGYQGVAYQGNAAFIERDRTMTADKSGFRSAPDDAATVIAAGVCAATLAALCHETVGHGLGCVIDHGRITLLTSIWFRCQGATSLTDAAGPLASLVGGLAALGLQRKGGADRVRQFVLILFGAISLFWFAGQLIEHAVINGDDWGIIARRNHWPPLWRPLSIAVGGAAYVGSIAWIASMLRRKSAPRHQAVILAYCAGAASAIIAGLAWHPAPIRSAVEGFLTLGIAPLGLLAASSRAARYNDEASPIPRSWPCIVMSLALFVAFACVQGRGIGTLALRGLLH